METQEDNARAKKEVMSVHTYQTKYDRFSKASAVLNVKLGVIFI